MKKIAAIGIVLILILSLAACGSSGKNSAAGSAGQANNAEQADHAERTDNAEQVDNAEQADTGSEEEKATAETSASDSTEAETESTSDMAKKSAASAENAQSDVQAGSVESTSGTVEGTSEVPENAGTQEDKTMGSNILVVYFSATGTTKGIAEMIADGLSADFYEIVPEKPYTAADLDYSDDNSRSSVEMNDSSARPAIFGDISDISHYEKVYLGYPIWWGEAPRILDTFVESHDFTGKTIIPFCTSGASGIGSSAATLESLAGTGTWVEGHRFSGSEDSAEVLDWAKQF